MSDIENSSTDVISDHFQLEIEMIDSQEVQELASQNLLLPLETRASHVTESSDIEIFTSHASTDQVVKVSDDYALDVIELDRTEKNAIEIRKMSSILLGSKHIEGHLASPYAGANGCFSLSLLFTLPLVAGGQNDQYEPTLPV